MIFPRKLTHHNTSRQARQTAFTLVEISIVLVIIGLIVGGILVGRELIHSYQLRKIISEENTLRTAVNTYKLKYNQLPGDDPAAQMKFGADCPDISLSQVCNGDGDGIIESDTGIYEVYRVMQHLALAGLINGSYVAKYLDPPENNWYMSSFQPGAFWIRQAQNSWVDLPRSMIYLTDPQNYYTPAALLVPIDAYSIDSKIDDGNPAYGNAFSFKITGATGAVCLNHTAGGSSWKDGWSYRMTSTDKECNMEFLMDF